ncbi:MAG TPA: hypothetical protein VLG50_05245 [Candidatus Saccharimonadales bacterium]|nr:hypothetical protein [Candidatus Saccharimonadales bacterium]
MLSWIGNYFNTEVVIAQQNFKMWQEWQNKQDSQHYLTSISSLYINQKANRKNIYHCYCFGDFENLIYTPEQCNEIDYISMLIHVYDNSKGYLRSVKGDIVGIKMLRTILVDQNMDPLYHFDFAPYMYPYDQIHAHTVAYFSLSTIILFLVSNYMHIKSYNADQFPSININLCKNAFTTKVFGDISYTVSRNNIPIVQKQSANIDIESVKNKDAVRVCHSWPGANHAAPINRCTNCKAVCENYWGTHKHCLNCHLYKVCFICGSDAVFSVSNRDNFLRCRLHINM